MAKRLGNHCHEIAPRHPQCNLLVLTKPLTAQEASASEWRFRSVLNENIGKFDDFLQILGHGTAMFITNFHEFGPAVQEITETFIKGARKQLANFFEQKQMESPDFTKKFDRLYDTTVGNLLKKAKQEKMVDVIKEKILLLFSSIVADLEVVDKSAFRKNSTDLALQMEDTIGQIDAHCQVIMASNCKNTLQTLRNVLIDLGFDDVAVYITKSKPKPKGMKKSTTTERSDL